MVSADSLVTVLALALAEACLVEATAAERLRRASYLLPATAKREPQGDRDVWLAERRDALDAYSLATMNLADALSVLRVARADAGLPII